MKLAVTGGSGFVGRRVLGLYKAPVTALARQKQPDFPGIAWVSGDLANATALSRLCHGNDTLIHIAGTVNAPDRAGFAAGNIAGTAAIIKAAQAAGIRRFVHVSSLAAREPGLSMYGASKAAGEALVKASALPHWVIVRPPAVYGPGDSELLGFFRLARYGIGIAPGEGRISIIHVDDLARALLALALDGPSGETLELDDGRGDAVDGYTHPEFLGAIGQALGRERLRIIMAPVSLLPAAATLAGWAARLTGNQPKLTRDRAAYIAHPDWVARGGNAALAGLWAPRFDAPAGLADTVAGYRQQGWL